MLDALGATSDAVDAAIPRADNLLRRYLGVKRAAWAARVALGNAMFRMEMAVAAAKPWALSDIVAGAEERGRLATVQTTLREVASADLPASVQAAFQRASAENFEGTPLAQRQAVVDALNQGRLPDVVTGEFRRRNTGQQRTIVDLAYVSLNEMVDRATALESDAHGKLLWSYGILLVSAAFVALGLLMVFRGVLRPIRMMTNCMRELAEGQLRVQVPFADRLPVHHRSHIRRGSRLQRRHGGRRRRGARR